MKRYDAVDDDRWITEVSDGDYILFTDHEAAIKKAVEEEREAIIDLVALCDVGDTTSDLLQVRNGTCRNIIRDIRSRGEKP